MRFLISIIWVIQLIQLSLAEVITLNDKNRGSVLVNSKFSLVYFSKPNCRYCETFEATYAALSQLYDNDEEFQILKIDVSENPLLKIKFNPTSYPSIYLYNDKDKVVKRFNEKRSLLNLINFINEHTDSINKEFPSKVHHIKSLEDFNTKRQAGNLIVISLSYLPDWYEYEYPTHFIQQLAYDYDMDFNIAFIDLIDKSEFLNDFKIANYPSVIYFDSPKKFKIYKTLIKDQVTDNKLDEPSLTDFVENLQTDDFGYWFNNFTELEDFITHKKYEYVDQIKFGFNLNKNHKIVDDDVAYTEMVNNIEI